MKKVKHLTDEALVELIRNKDQELYAELMRRYQEKLLRYAVFLIGDEQLGDDAVQEAFIKAFVNLQGFNAKRKFSSWIYRIVHNEAMNQIKKYKKEAILEPQQLKNLKDKDPGVEAAFEKKEAKKLLRNCLKKLPVKYRSPMALFYFENKSYGEISDVLRLPIGTVGTRINRGKKLMASICRQKGGENYV